jgi:hypothetical protein
LPLVKISFSLGNSALQTVNGFELSNTTVRWLLEIIGCVVNSILELCFYVGKQQVRQTA